MLSGSLVHYFPPKHHIRALRIIDGVLSEMGMEDLRAALPKIVEDTEAELEEAVNGFDDDPSIEDESSIEQQFSSW